MSVSRQGVADDAASAVDLNVLNTTEADSKAAAANYRGFVAGVFSGFSKLAGACISS